MTTADEVAETTLRVVRSNVGTDEAVSDILACCADKQVSVVMARRRFQEAIEQNPDDADSARAVEVLDTVLQQGPWA